MGWVALPAPSTWWHFSKALPEIDCDIIPEEDLSVLMEMNDNNHKRTEEPEMFINPGAVKKRALEPTAATGFHPLWALFLFIE